MWRCCAQGRAANEETDLGREGAGDKKGRGGGEVKRTDRNRWGREDIWREVWQLFLMR